MKTWRGLGLICASLLFGLSACGDSHEPREEDSTSPARHKDGGLDSGEDPPDEVDADAEEDSSPPVVEDVDAGLDSGMSTVCEPKSCRDQGFNCGTPDDGCGGPLNCGTCDKATEDLYDSCGGGGKPNVCGCTPATCESLSSERGAVVCDTVADGCGGTIPRGNSCSGTNTCGGGPAANQCGCTPNPNPCAGKECGSASDGCGNTVQCGASAGACSANKECNGAQACVCKADQSAFCGTNCGPQVTPDGCAVNCGTCQALCAAGEGVACGSTCECPAPGTCRSTGTCCVPETAASLCGTAQCGTRVNRCGQTVQCGTACTGGQVCSSEGKCDTPAAAALIGKYAVRSVGFGVAQGIATRAAGLLLVDIYRSSNGDLIMREQSCWSGAYQKGTICGAGQTENCCPPGTADCELPVTTVAPAVSARAIPTEIGLDLAQSASVTGPKDWMRPVQPADQNAAGWRRGWPSYCPAGGGAPDPSLPGYGPAGGGTRALGALKPWLNGAACRCPIEEVDARVASVADQDRPAWCNALSGAAKLTCVQNWAQNHLPFANNSSATATVAALAANVTDCRVVDDDIDELPGNTVDVKATLIITVTAKIGSASVTANEFWGTADTSGAKRHWGVSQDQPALESANVWCRGSSLLCGTSSGNLCPGYRSQPYDKEHRLNPVDFVPLSDKTPPAGGWANPGQDVAASCSEIYARRNDAGWFSPVIWSTRYPTASDCQL